MTRLLWTIKGRALPYIVLIRTRKTNNSIDHVALRKSNNIRYDNEFFKKAQEQGDMVLMMEEDKEILCISQDMSAKYGCVLEGLVRTLAARYGFTFVSKVRVLSDGPAFWTKVYNKLRMIVEDLPPHVYETKLPPITDLLDSAATSGTLVTTGK